MNHNKPLNMLACASLILSFLFTVSAPEKVAGESGNSRGSQLVSTQKVKKSKKRTKKKRKKRKKSGHRKKKTFKSSSM